MAPEGARPAGRDLDDAARIGSEKQVPLVVGDALAGDPGDLQAALEQFKLIAYDRAEVAIE